MVSVADAYEKARTTPSDFWEHVSFVADLVVEHDAKTVIELGTRTGVSTAGWLYGLARTGGHLWSVDLDPEPDLGISEGWTFLQGDDLDPKVFGRLPVADIVFIDTSHDYNQTLAELNVYRWKVKPGGLIVLHDTELARPLGTAVLPRYPVKTAIEVFCHEEGFAWSNRPMNFGLGVIEIV